MGPGETSQARALATYIAEQGEDVYFGVRQKANLWFIELNGTRFKRIFIAPTADRFAKIARRIKPDVIVFCNSKIWEPDEKFHQAPIFPGAINVCLDSNWLFNKKLYPPKFKFISWADKYFITFPKRVFENGLKKNGGGFVIGREMRDKILPVGFIPSYSLSGAPRGNKARVRRKYKIKPGEKFIFSYFSGHGATHRVWAFYNLIKAVDKLISEDKKIKVLYVGRTDDLDPEMLQRPWLIAPGSIEAGDEFFLTLAASDLVFQHQGLATLSQAISARVPVIANIAYLKDKPLPRIHFWEVGPFEKAGVCKILTKSTLTEKVASEIKALLYDKKQINAIKTRQQKLYESGEKEAYSIIKGLLEKK